MDIGADLYGADLCEKRLFVQEAEIPTAGRLEHPGGSISSTLVARGISSGGFT